MEHRTETVTPLDGKFLVDCSCGASYEVESPGSSLDFSTPHEARKLADAEFAHAEVAHAEVARAEGATTS